MLRYTCKLCGAKVHKNPLKHLRKVHAKEFEILIRDNLHYDLYYSVGALWNKQPQSFKALGKPIFEKDCQSYSFVWDDIQFKDRQIQIYIKRLDKRFLPLECKNATESLNKIKEEFFRRFHGSKLYKLKALDNKIMLNWSKDVQEIMDLVNSMVDYYSFRYEKIRKTRHLNEETLLKLSNEEIVRFFKIKQEKEPYIRFLFNKHHQSFKLVPILESIGSSHEESFLFRIEDTAGQQLVVWENLNPARATYVFRIRENSPKFKQILQYIAEQEQAKRSFLRQHANQRWAKETLGFVCYIEHDDFDNYEWKIENLIRFRHHQ